jgi:hypothetical protein
VAKSIGTGTPSTKKTSSAPQKLNIRTGTGGSKLTVKKSK